MDKQQSNKSKMVQTKKMKAQIKDGPGKIKLKNVSPAVL